jgi:hypothetical protein
MADGISLLDIPQAAPAELAAGQFVYVVTPDGTPYKADISDVVSRMQAVNNCICVHQTSRVITSAELLASNTTPIVLVTAPPTGFVHDVISVFASTDGNFTAPPYATNTTLEVITQGATVAQFTSSFLASTTNRIVKFFPNAVSIASNSNMVNGNLLLKTFGGDPTAGTYDIKVYVAYRIVEL